MDREIPVVDITSSQDEVYQQSNGRKRKEELTIVEASPKRTRCGGESPTSSQGNSIVKADLAKLHTRLALLENSVIQAEQQKVEDQYVTREEFDEVLGKVSRFEERLSKMEQIIKNLKAAFVGTNSQSQHRSYPENSTPRISSTARSSGPKSTSTMTTSSDKTRAQAIPSVASSRPVPSTMTKANKLVAAQTRPEPTSVGERAASQPTDLTTAPPNQSRLSGQIIENNTIAAGNLRNTPKRQSLPTERTELPLIGNGVSISRINKKAGPAAAGRHQQRVNTPQRTGSSSTPGRDQQLLNTPQRSGPSPTSGRDQPLLNTPKGTGSSTSRLPSIPSSRAGPSPTIGREQNSCLTSSDVPRNLLQILHAPPSERSSASADALPNEWSGASAINMDDLHEELQIKVKKEVFENLPERINNPATLRRDSDGRILVYIDGNSKKKRNQELFAGVAYASLGENWTRTIPYISDIQIQEQGNLKKLGDAVRKQTEVMAAYVAIEDIKRNYNGQIKIKIVARCNKLVQIMRRELHLVYPYNKCKCSVFPCKHLERWETADNFAKLLHDDLPRLVVASSSKDVDVVWRNYEPNDPQIDTNELKKAVSSVLQKCKT